MWKTVLAATAAVAIAGTTLVYGQQRFNDAGAGPDGPRHWRPSAEDIGAFTDARVAALKAGLKLTVDQEKNWPAFEQAYRELAKLRSDRMERRFEQRRDNPGAADCAELGALGPVYDQDMQNMSRVQKGLQNDGITKVNFAQYQEMNIRNFHANLSHYVEK